MIVDSVTDGTLGTGLKQYVAIMDGTVNGTGKLVIDANGADVDVTRIAGKAPAYTEGDTDATIDGVPLLWEDTSDTLRPASAAKPLPVNIITGAVAGIQYTEADIDTTITGTAVMWEDTGDTMRPASAAKPLPVNVVTGSAAGTEYTEGDIDTTVTGTAVMWEDASDTLRVSSATKPFPVNPVVSDITAATPFDTVGVVAFPMATPPNGITGLTALKLISAASTNATSVKGSAGQLYWIYAHSTNAAVRYLKLYNKATAPTVGTDTPILTLPIPASTAGAGFLLSLTVPIVFSTGIALALTTGVLDSDTGAVAANELVLAGGYR